MAICSIIEDFALVGFETLAVEDKVSMLNLMRVIDRATGYVYVPPTSGSQPGTVNDPNTTSTSRPNTYSLFSSAVGPMRGLHSNVRDVQERWIDSKEEWDAWEKVQWRKEGYLVQEQKAKGNVRAR